MDRFANEIRSDAPAVLTRPEQAAHRLGGLGHGGLGAVALPPGHGAEPGARAGAKAGAAAAGARRIAGHCPAAAGRIARIQATPVKFLAAISISALSKPSADSPA